MTLFLNCLGGGLMPQPVPSSDKGEGTRKKEKGVLEAGLLWLILGQNFSVTKPITMIAPNFLLIGSGSRGFVGLGARRVNRLLLLAKAFFCA